MIERKQLRIWQWATVLLLLCNIVLIGVVWYTLPRGGGNAPRDRVIAEVGLKADQVSHYEELIKDHRREMQRLRKAGRLFRDSLFAQLGKPAVLPDTLIARIGQNQQQIELVTYRHFEQVRALCDDGQKEKFDQIIGDVLRMMNPGKPHRPDGPGNGDEHGRNPHDRGDSPEGPPPPDDRQGPPNEGDRRPPPDRH
jgi:hypothetical protein